uniref:Uncharacterized protein n=1 Tax=Rhizophora mucronata TaxID=61149 RepID=A0A2P2QZY1_RHIMU
MLAATKSISILLSMSVTFCWLLSASGIIPEYLVGLRSLSFSQLHVFLFSLLQFMKKSKL